MPHVAATSKGHEPSGDVLLEQLSSDGKMASVLVDGQDPLGDRSSACILESAGSKGTLSLHDVEGLCLEGRRYLIRPRGRI